MARPSVDEVFADTFFFLALINAGDAHYGKAIACSKSVTRIATTEFVLLELADALAARRRQSFLKTRNDLIADRSIRIVRLDMALYEDAIELYRDRPDKEWSLTDCTSFVVMTRLGLTEALTGDRHFEQAGFVALFRR